MQHRSLYCWLRLNSAQPHVVEWLYDSKRKIIDKRADLTDFSCRFSSEKCVFFVSRPMKIVTFLRKSGETPKRVVDFPLERDTFRKKSWKSSRILRVKPNCFIFSFFHLFFSFFHFHFHFLSFSFIFFHFLSFSFIFFVFFLFFIFFNFLSFFIFFHFLSFSFIFFHFFPFFHFLSFFHFSSFSFVFFHFHFLFVGAQNLIYFWHQFRYDFN